MKNFILYCSLIAAASAYTRLSLDEEELKHAKLFREEALAVERALSTQELGHYVEPAPLHEGRHLGLGLGVQVGPVGYGWSAGIGKHGVGFNTQGGYGQDYLSYGSPEHYSQYYTTVPSYRYLPHTQSRTLGLNGAFNLGPVAGSAGITTGGLSNLGLGLGTGLNVGPVGVGASAGLGHGNIGLSAGLGWGGKYSNYGTPQHYKQYYANPYNGPYFHPAQLV